MGEIKSTLDLVMEKTRNLTLSADEKAAQQHKEAENRIRGLLQKYLDGVVSKPELKADHLRLKKGYGADENTILIDEIIGRIEPNGDNQPLLEVLREVGGIDPSGIEALLRSFRKDYLTAAEDRTAQLKADLARRHRICGSAVVPNLEADAQWQREQSKLHTEFKEQLAALCLPLRERQT